MCAGRTVSWLQTLPLWTSISSQAVWAGLGTGQMVRIEGSRYYCIFLCYWIAPYYCMKTSLTPYVFLIILSTISCNTTLNCDMPCHAMRCDAMLSYVPYIITFTFTIQAIMRTPIPALTYITHLIRGQTPHPTHPLPVPHTTLL